MQCYKRRFCKEQGSKRAEATSDLPLQLSTRISPVLQAAEWILLPDRNVLLLLFTWLLRTYHEREASVLPLGALPAVILVVTQTAQKEKDIVKEATFVPVHFSNS